MIKLSNSLPRITFLLLIIILAACSRRPSNNNSSDVGDDIQSFDTFNDNNNDINFDITGDTKTNDQLIDLIEDTNKEQDTKIDLDLPGYCSQWKELRNLELLQAIHKYLHDTYNPSDVDGDYENARYINARNLMYTDVEWYYSSQFNTGGIECIYTGTFLALNQGHLPDSDTEMNCEHSWPKSRMENDQDSLLFSHQESDIHILYPALPDVNKARGSYYYGNPVSSTRYYYNEQDNTEFAIIGKNSRDYWVFKPRADRIGDIARSIFYFSVRWGKDVPYYEEDDLRKWYYQDPVDEIESSRNDNIADIQGNRNPFVDCPDLLKLINDFIRFEIIDTNDNLPSP